MTDVAAGSKNLVSFMIAREVLGVETGYVRLAEVTDAAEGSRSECVMLNKGKYMKEAVIMLDDILERMEEHLYKETATLRPLGVARNQEGEDKQ